jgi:hypothetical protein
MRARASLPTLVLMLSLSGCAPDHLPEHDLRILQANPTAKLSASDLWNDFQSDADGARRRYFGTAIDISDRPTAVNADTPGRQFLFFAQAENRGVKAQLLEDRAPEILKDAKPGQRLTLRCLCEGLDAAGDVLLKSCIKP